MDDKTKVLEAEIEWLYEEIKEHQQEAERLRQVILDLKYSPLAQKHLEN